MNMKKSFIAMGLMLAASTLTNCSKDETVIAPDQRQGFTIQADYTPMAPESRTSIDPATGKVAWDAQDALTVFAVEAGTTPSTWTAYEFTAQDPSQGTFTNSKITIDPAKSYDWYIMSPYSSYVKNPLGDSKGGTFQIGNQTQDHAAPTAHLTETDIMTGVAKNVAGSQRPSVALNHLATLMKFTIVNKETKAITPSMIQFTAPSNVVIGGRFAVDFATGALTASTKWNSLTLTLKDAPAIEPNGSYDVYVMMAPFTLASGDTFTIKVVSDNDYSEQTRTMSREVRFEAGKMNGATINYVAAKPDLITGNWSATLGAAILGETGNNSKIYPQVNLAKLFWDTSYTWGNGTNTYLGGSATDGAQIGSGSNYCKQAVFSTLYYGSPVTSVTVNAKGASKVSTAQDATLSVSVNGVEYTTTGNPLTKTLKDFTFNVPDGSTAQTGEIVITMTNPTAKGALYIKKITIATN